ncbi:hypothetical protein PoB_004989500 [Plakobranchus ocellatus]|uniref:WSC domain-containing protein n=1 Tax=Plakobranchus ocellatus TaxID=259542 RepID=A0AAV4BVM8_9GAST|nr:hypothetical protein PoB_004989500 [Plakobranchus ocellatus]
MLISYKACQYLPNLFNVLTFFLKILTYNQDATQIIFEFCGKEAVAKKKAYFGVEFYGECYFGDEQDLSLGQGLVKVDECEDRCKWDVGGPHTMMIYKVEDVLGGYTCSNKYSQL